MKKLIALLLAAIMVFALTACSNDSGSTTSASSDTSLKGTYDITVWCADAIVDLTKKQIEDFNKTNKDGITFNATVEPVSEPTPPPT